MIENLRKFAKRPVPFTKSRALFTIRQKRHRILRAKSLRVNKMLMKSTLGRKRAGEKTEKGSRNPIQMSIYVLLSFDTNILLQPDTITTSHLAILH